MDADIESLAFNVSAFIAGLFLLQYSNDSFIDNTNIVLVQSGLPATLSHLLTAGTRWQEAFTPLLIRSLESILTLYVQIAIVIAASIQSQPSVGFGNVLGSSISNILIGLAVAMLAHSPDIEYAGCIKFYSLASLIAASVFLLITYVDRFTGAFFFLVLVGVYIVALGGGIYDGFLKLLDVEQGDPEEPQPKIYTIPSSVFEVRPSVCTPLLGPTPFVGRTPKSSFQGSISTRAPGKFRRSGTFRQPVTVKSISPFRAGNKIELRCMSYHITHLIFASIGLAISGFVLAYAASNLSTELNISKPVFGIIVLSVSSTLPEKLIYVLMHVQENSSLLVASTAGSNVFLLILCLALLFLAGEGGADSGLAAEVYWFEIWTTWGCSLLLVMIVHLGGKKWIGAVLLGLYAGFICAELTVFKK